MSDSLAELSRDERSEKWREEHEIRPYALEYENTRVNLED